MRNHAAQIQGQIHKQLLVALFWEKVDDAVDGLVGAVGMQTFDQALEDLYNDGKISYEEALRNADSVNDLRLSIKLKGNAGDGNQNDPLSSLNLMDDTALAESLNS